MVVKNRAYEPAMTSKLMIRDGEVMGEITEIYREHVAENPWFREG